MIESRLEEIIEYIKECKKKERNNYHDILEYVCSDIGNVYKHILRSKRDNVKIDGEFKDLLRIDIRLTDTTEYRQRLFNYCSVREPKSARK